jgi:iron(III) transport system substrate-binding protein
MAAPTPDPTSNSWPKDEFGRDEMRQQFLIFGWPAVLALLILLALWAGCWKRPGAFIVVYAAQDQVFAEPILRQFEREAGIRVRAVYDSEAVKTVGLANRLLAERARPQCDVFWGNEELRTRQLAAQGVFRETNGWASFGHRSRRLVTSARLEGLPPLSSLLDLTNAVYRDRVALAYPLFGTTSTHFLALRQKWGESNWLAWCRALQANKPRLMEGNSVAARWVAAQPGRVGLTDSDDVQAVRREGGQITEHLLTPEMLLLPNTVGVIRQAPHPDAAQRLFEFLQRPGTLEQLRAAGALEATTPSAVPETLAPNWSALLTDLDRGMEQLKEIFLR